MKNKEKIVAFSLFGRDIGSMYMCREETPGVCPVCFNRLDDIVNMYYRVRKKKGDIFYTYDHFCIVTEKFKKFCEENEYPDLQFTAITASTGFYHFRPNGIYRLDYARRETMFINKRGCCGSYDEVIGATPAYKEHGFVLPSDDFILCSEYWFGSFEKKSPLIIVGLETKMKMKEYGLKGCEFDYVYE